MNPPQFSNGSCFTTSGPSKCSEISRYHFHLDTGFVEATGFPNLMKGDMSRYINQFDFPTINEAYRGKEVGQFKIILDYFFSKYREFSPYANFITANFITAVFQNYY